MANNEKDRNNQSGQQQNQKNQNQQENPSKQGTTNENDFQKHQKRPSTVGNEPASQNQSSKSDPKKSTAYGSGTDVAEDEEGESERD